MSKPVVVDASVAVKWFLPENGDAAANEILGRAIANRVQLVAPDLLLLEVANAVWKRANSQAMPPHEAFEILSALHGSPLTFYAARGLATDALPIAIETGCTVYDCTYVALAARLDTAVVTADRKLAGRLQATPFVDRVVLLP